jgi:EmrB/QacA subfamily drug resistance transporter
MTDLQQAAAPLTGTAAGRRAPARAVTVLLTSVAYFMVALDALVVVTALPSVHRDLGGSIGTLQWTVNIYSLAFGAGIITAAALGDRLGRRRVYVTGLAVFTLASAACALAPSAGVLIACRGVQGLGAAIILPLGLTLLTSAFPPERRGTVVGIWGGIAGLAVASGPLIGGAVTQGLDWHWIFWVNVPIGIAAAIGARLWLAESRGPRTRLDVPALVLVSAGIGALTWGLVHGTEAGWGTPGTLAALVAGAGLIAALIVWERITREPMIPPALLRNPKFSAASATQFLTTSAIYSAAFLISQFFQAGQGQSPLATGLRFLPWTATPLLVAPAAGALFDRIGARRLVIPGLIMQAAGFGLIVWLAGHGAGYPAYVAPFVLAGVGISMALPCIPAAGLNAVPAAALGKAAGVLNTMQQFGAVAGVAIVTAVFSAHGSLASPAAVTSGFRPALAGSAVLSLAGAAVAAGLGARARR